MEPQETINHQAPALRDPDLLKAILERVEAIEEALKKAPHPRVKDKPRKPPKATPKKAQEVTPEVVTPPATKKPHRPHSILEPSDIPAIRDLVALKFPYARIGKLFGVSASAIQAIAEKRTWRDVESNPIPLAERKVVGQ